MRTETNRGAILPRVTAAAVALVLALGPFVGAHEAGAVPDAGRDGPPISVVVHERAPAPVSTPVTAPPGSDPGRVRAHELGEIVAWAVARFEAASLDLPALRIAFYGGDRSACGYFNDGLHTVSGATHDIAICTTTPAWTRVVLLHELAHAWSDHALTPDRQRAFVEVRGLDRWFDSDAQAWAANATEQAAETIVWGIIDRPYRARIPGVGCSDLDAGYRALTGLPPLHGIPDRCER